MGLCSSALPNYMPADVLTLLLLYGLCKLGNQRVCASLPAPSTTHLNSPGSVMGIATFPESLLAFLSFIFL